MDTAISQAEETTTATNELMDCHEPKDTLQKPKNSPADTRSIATTFESTEKTLDNADKTIKDTPHSSVEVSVDTHCTPNQLPETLNIDTKNTLEVPQRSSKPQTLTIPPALVRRSSSRSIKRPKFDDELVDTSAFKRTSMKSSDLSPSDPKLKKTLSKQTTQPLQAKKKTRKIKPKPVPSNFGRWRPTDDLALISAVTQTCDLHTVHLTVTFSCNFTLKEIQDRWFALLYDPLVSKLSQQSMSALPMEVVHKIKNNPLWSREEEAVLIGISKENTPSLEEFQQILDENLTTFHHSRTAQTLRNHWLVLRNYHLLSIQSARNANTGPTLQDIENKMFDDQIIGREDDDLNQELTANDVSDKREIKKLEQEIEQWAVMLEKTDLAEKLEVTKFPQSSYAVLKGRVLKYYFMKETVIFGRKNNQFQVDIDATLEGPSLKISKKQGVFTMKDGRVYLQNCGRKPFYVNGVPLPSGKNVQLFNNSIIEIYCLKFLFNMNDALLSTLTKEEVKIEDTGTTLQT